MLKGLEVYTIKADEGVIGEGNEIGDYGPYYQSARKEIYQTYAKALLNKGLRIRAFALPRRLTKSGNSRKMMT